MEQHNTKLAEAVTKVMNSIYNQYQGLQVKPIPKYEDEDFTVEVTIPVHLPINKVEQSFHIKFLVNMLFFIFTQKSLLYTQNLQTDSLPLFRYVPLYETPRIQLR